MEEKKICGDAHRKARPDLVLGYNRGYRAGWETVLGSAMGGVLENNAGAWSGDHCIDPALVRACCCPTGGSQPNIRV